VSLRRSLHRLLALVQSRRLDRELDGEILAHLEMAGGQRRRRNVAGRGSPAAAADSGSRSDEHRDGRSLRWTLASDFRYGLASLRRDRVCRNGIRSLPRHRPSAAVFRIVDGVLLKLTFPAAGAHSDVLEARLTLNFVDWKRLNTVFRPWPRKT
jgi:hypothetical protein